MSVLSKLGLYARAARATRSLNWRGLPIVPKAIWRGAPANRAAYNQFILWIRRLQLPRAGWIVDAGANHGDFSQAASDCFPGAQVLLIEPLPTLHSRLEHLGRERQGRWHLAKCALGSEIGEAALHVDPERDDIGSLAGFSADYLRAHPGIRPAQSFPCRVDTLDGLCAAHGISCIDLLKIDVEGFEFEALAGAANMLRSTNALVIEVSLVRRADEFDPVTRLLSLLREAGLRLVELYPSVFSKEAPWLPLEFNVLARRP